MKRPDCIKDNVLLAPLTTLEVGGPARLYAACDTLEQLQQVLEWARAEQQDVFVLGGGSNVLIADQGFDGLVVSYRAAGLEFEASGDACIVRADAGVNWDHFVARCVEQKLAGVECLSGIPGLVGAAPIQNIGAYGQEIGDSVVAVTGIDMATLESQRVARDDCGFGYRTSVFKTDWRHFLVTQVELQLEQRDRGLVAYPDIRKKLSDIAAPTLAETRAAVLECRLQKSMVLTPDDPNRRSAGSFFVNPVLTEKEFEAVCARAGQLGISAEDVPSYPAGDGKAKVPAAWLIERSGLKRGASDGNVGLSTRHALAIVNKGGATADDIIRFAAKVRTAVHTTFGVALTPEPVLVT